MFARKILLLLLFLFLWFFFVLYPNPYKLYQSINRIFNPPIDTISVYEIVKEVEGKTPLEIERYVLDNVKYKHDWKTYGYPWYFPSVAEVIEIGEGDCKSRLIVIASIFESMAIEYDFLFSITHIWINYKDKMPTQNENEKIAMFSKSKGFKTPEVDWSSSRQTFKAAFWECMPHQKKDMLLMGPYLALFLGLISKRSYL